MRSFSSRRDARKLVGAFAAALMVALAWAAQPPADAIAGQSKAGLAQRLMALDPGALLGGNTQVVTGKGAGVVGVPGRPNFIIGLDSGQRIVGGDEADQLGVRRERGQIDGGAGADLIVGGPERDRINGGPGADLIYGGAERDKIKGGAGDDTVIKGDLPGKPASRTSATAAGQPSELPVSGDGSNDNPFTAPCDDPSQVDCVVNSFKGRSLAGLWANEYVPAYKCPSDHPRLIRKVYTPFGTQTPNGVEVAGLGPIGVSIAGASFFLGTTTGGSTVKVATGTLTGGVNSSATSWSAWSNTYRVILHCTSDPSHGYFF
jgi:hypothetical protein